MKLIYLLTLIIAVNIAIKANDELRLMRFPSIFNETVVFSYAGDLYKATIKEGNAIRLTSHEGYESFPRISPDGEWIAFTGQYDGNTEVYCMPMNGGQPKRLTFTPKLGRDDISDRMGPNNIVMGWTPDGKDIIYRNRMNSFNDFVGHLYQINASGGAPKRIELSEGGFCSYSADGTTLAFNRVFREFRTWKYYKGGMADDIWTFNTSTKEIKNLTNNVAQDIFPMWFNNHIYFISDRERTMNLYKIDLINNNVSKVSDYKDYDIKFPSINGSKIVYENAGYLYLFDCITEQTQKLKITLNPEAIHSRNGIINVGSEINVVDISTDGERIVLDAHGDIFTLPGDNKGVTRNLTNSNNANDRDAVWSPDGNYIAWISDRSGEYEIYMQKSNGSSPAIQLTSGIGNYIFALRWSPNSKYIAFNDRRNKLYTLNTATKELKTLAKSKVEPIYYFNWSPDNQYIAYQDQASNHFDVIKIVNITNLKTFIATDTLYNSQQPVFSTNGKYLLYTSNRDFKPNFSQIEFNYSYFDMSSVYITLLAANTPSPFLLSNKEAFKELLTANEIKNNSKSDSKDAKLATEDAVKVTIDENNIQLRSIALPIATSNYSNLICTKDRVYYYEKSYVSNIQSGKYFDLVSLKETTIGNDIYFTVSSNQKKMLVRQKGSFYVIDLPSAQVNLSDKVNTSNLKYTVDYKAEWQQIYNEAWRQMRDFFYVENMHGTNWSGIQQKYAELLPFVDHRDDLTYLIGEMIGELNVGHAYISGNNRTYKNSAGAGILGADFIKDTNTGYFVITKIYTGSIWSKYKRSPLAELGINVTTGDAISEIQGVKVNTYNQLEEALLNTVGQTIEIKVAKQGNPKNLISIYLEPISSQQDLIYQEWVKQNIEKVNKASNGQIGYLHIPDMSPQGLNEFVEYYYPQLTKKAIIIDDRGNGGGFVSPLIIERLRREITRAKKARNSETLSSSPNEVFLGPMAMLIDKYSASDGDLIAYAFRKHDLGPLIGTRTWGGVVGISSSLPFIDGTDLRKPEFASYSAEKSEWIIEGTGVNPDIVIDNDPYQEFIGYDSQLSKAIEVLLQKIETESKAIPAIPKDPIR